MSIFMKCEGIAGESSDKRHQGWIDVDHIDWCVARRISANPGTRYNREVANAEITDLMLARRMDSATPLLFIKACCGKGQTITIHFTKTGTGSGSDPFLEYVLHNALISDYHVSAQSGDVERPTEELIISFQELEIKYVTYDNDGNVISPVVVAFDTSTNTKK